MEAYLPAVFGGLLTLAVTLLGFLIKRLFKTQDLLFRKRDEVRADIDRVKLAMLTDPSRTAMFNAFMGAKREPDC